VFVDERRFPDVSDEYNTMLHNIDRGSVLCKLKHPLPNPNGPPDPLLLFAYNKAQHRQWLHEQLDLSHLNKPLRDRIYALVIKYWSVFDDHSVFIPVRIYKCVIDSGNATPIAIKKIYYGPTEIPIMRKAIAAYRKWGTSIKYTMGIRSLRQSLPPNCIKSMFITSMTLCGGSV
jgi:hypothetical protein